MKFPKMKTLFAAIALTVSAGAFAADADLRPLDNAEIESLAAAESAADLATLVQNLVAANVDPSSIAAALAARGQTNAQIQALLSSANVSGATLAQALATANSTRAALAEQGSSSADQSVEVTGAGLLVDENGNAVVVESEQDQALLAAAFVANQVAQNPRYFQDNPNAAAGVASVLTAAILASNPNANPTAVAQAVLDALQNANFTGGNSTAVLAQALQNAAQSVGGGITIPPVSANS